MNTIPTNQPTRYEITAKHTDGREFLISYAAGSPSLRRLVRIVNEKSEHIAAKTGLADTARFDTGAKPHPFARANAGEGWTLAYTGRTQREVLTLNDARPFVAA